MNSPKYATFMPPLCQLMHAVSGIERRRKETAYLELLSLMQRDC